MDGRGLRPILQPVLYVGAAVILHALLFLIPAGGPAKRDSETTRGIRVKTYVEGPPAAAPSTSPRNVRTPTEISPATLPQAPAAVRDQYYSAMGSKTASGDSRDIGIQDGGSRPQGASTAGEGGPSLTPEQGREGPPSKSDYGLYLDRLHSSGVQQWARESAQKSRKGWKGTGMGGGTEGWGKGSKTAVLSGAGKGAGKGKGTSGTGSGGDGALYMDPRVRMVVTSYPPTGIEQRYGIVRYPDLKFKKSEYTSGWWNVYIEIGTDKNGKIIKYNILRPETDGPLERQFVGQVKKEIEKWSFEPKEAEIHVDVRFYVE